MKSPIFRWLVGALASPLLFASVLLAGFCPFPVSVAFVQYGIKLGLLSFILNTAIVTFLYRAPSEPAQNSMDPLGGAILGSEISYGLAMAMIFVLIAAPAGITLGVGFLKKWTPGKSILLSTLVGILGVGAFLQASSTMEGKSLEQYIEEKSHKGLQYFRKVYNDQVKEKEVTVDAQNQFNKIFEQYDKSPDRVISQIKRDIFPNIVYLFGLLAWVNGILMIGYCRRIPGYNPPWSWDYLIRWKSPERLIWVTIGVIALWVFGLEPSEGFSESALRILIFIYFLHGISVIGYLFHHYRVVGPFRIMGYLAVILFGKILVAGLGMFDLWWDIRAKIDGNSETNPEEDEKDETPEGD